jgi:serine/threonine protein kinase
LRSTYCGTPFYLSPEILKGHKYDEKVDLWAIGILAYELLLGKSPFEIYDYEDLYKIVTNRLM